MKVIEKACRKGKSLLRFVLREGLTINNVNDSRTHSGKMDVPKLE